jgi:hypothetical protein
MTMLMGVRMSQSYLTVDADGCATLLWASTDHKDANYTPDARLYYHCNFLYLRLCAQADDNSNSTSHGFLWLSLSVYRRVVAKIPALVIPEKN